VLIFKGTSKVKTILKSMTDAYMRKPGEQNRLDTCVVLAVNDGCLILVLSGIVANALNFPPKDYDRKIKT